MRPLAKLNFSLKLLHKNEDFNTMYDPKLNFGMDSIIEMVNLVFLKNKSYILYEKLPEKISLDCIIWWPF